MALDTMNRFSSFHGMLCSPRLAQECISNLTGTILFMPSNYKKKGIRHYLYTDLNVWTYYGLVFASLTGLSTLLGLTQTLRTEENLTHGVNCPEFENDPEIYQIVLDPTSSHHTAYTAPPPHSQEGILMRRRAKVIRLFSYYFSLPMIRVQMFHVIDEDAPEKLHLVEIFEVKNRLSSVYALSGFLFASFYNVCKREKV